LFRDRGNKSGFITHGGCDNGFSKNIFGGAFGRNQFRPWWCQQYTAANFVVGMGNSNRQGWSMRALRKTNWIILSPTVSRVVCGDVNLANLGGSPASSLWWVSLAKAKPYQANCAKGDLSTWRPNFLTHSIHVFDNSDLFNNGGSFVCLQLGISKTQFFATYWCRH